MTIKELIDKLKKYPEDMNVVVDGYENGYDDVHFKTKKIIAQTKTERQWWDGKYLEDKFIGVKSLVISRNTKEQ